MNEASFHGSSYYHCMPADFADWMTRLLLDVVSGGGVIILSKVS